MSSRSYILQIMLWHQSLKNNRFEGQNMGGIKDMLSPHVKTWGGYIPPSPPGFTPLHVGPTWFVLILAE